MSRFPWLALGLSVLAAAVHGLPAGAESLELRRELLGAEPWRLVTGHLVHWSLDHMVWDVLTFLGIAVLCERISRCDLAWVLALATPAISLAVLALRPELPVYRGLSGLDVALFALLAGQLRGWLGAGLGAAVAGKVLYEFATGSALFVTTPPGGVVLVPEAHLAGAAVAALYIACTRLGSGWRLDWPAPRGQTA